MDEQPEQELEQADTWDYSRPHKRPGVKKQRAVVTVAFARDDFEQVAAHAEQLGTTVSGFIRSAVMEAIRRAAASAASGSPGDPPTLTYANRPLPTRLVWSERTANVQDAPTSQSSSSSSSAA
jgi:hypothetical protein